MKKAIILLGIIIVSVLSVLVAAQTVGKEETRRVSYVKLGAVSDRSVAWYVKHHPNSAVFLRECPVERCEGEIVVDGHHECAFCNECGMEIK